jgi:uncharacterized protein (UPF0305 family)
VIQKGKSSDDLKRLLQNVLMWRALCALEELVKKVLKDRRGKDYLENAYQKLLDSVEDIAQELEEEIQKGRLEKESLDEKAVNTFIQYYAIDHEIELDEKLSWHSCRI